jgi:NAD-dependent deacetylase sirtuin 7
VSRILRKAAAERSAEEGRLLAESEDLVTELQGRSRRREGLKRRQEEASRGQRVLGGGLREASGGNNQPGSYQVCDDPEELRRKVRELAGAVRSARHLVVYTGAGISTVSEGLRVASGVRRPLLGCKLGLYSAGVQNLAHL